MKNRKRFKIIWNFSKKYMSLFAVAEFCIIVSYIVALLLPLNLTMLTDKVLYLKNEKLLSKVIINYIVLFLTSIISNLIYAYTWQTLSNKYVVDVKNKLFERIMYAKAEFLSDMRSGDVMNSIDKDADQFIHVIQRNIFHFFNSIILCLGIIYMIVRIDIVLAIAVVFSALFPILFTRLNSKYVFDISSKIRNTAGELTGNLFEILKGMRDIRLLCAQWWAAQRIFQPVKKIINFNNDFQKINFVVNQGVGFINTMTTLIVYGLSAYFILNGNITIGIFLAIIQYVSLLNKKFNWILQLYLDWHTRKVSIDRVIGITENDIENVNGNDFDEIIESIEFKDVTFKYNKEIILNEISFIINKGERVAIVGESGVGKSTITKLLLRFYSPQRGEILFNNQNIGNLKYTDIRKSIGIVQQDILLLNHTIRYNLVFNNEISDQEILCVCEKVGLKETVMNLPRGLYTKVEMNSNTIDLSGGQKQRLMVARALLKKARIFIFDEATSALDIGTERKITGEIDKLGRENIVIIVSHRLDAIKNCDKIIILRDGQIQQISTYEELIKNSEVCYNMFNYEAAVE